MVQADEDNTHETRMMTAAEIRLFADHASRTVVFEAVVQRADLRRPPPSCGCPVSPTTTPSLSTLTS
jgi:hypothetical protein